MALDFITLWIVNTSVQENKSLYFSSGFYLFFYRIAIQFFNTCCWQSSFTNSWAGKNMKIRIFSSQCHLLSTGNNLTPSNYVPDSRIVLVSILAMHSLYEVTTQNNSKTWRQTYKAPCYMKNISKNWLPTVLVRLGHCKQNIIDRVPYKQQKFVAQSSGGWTSKVSGPFLSCGLLTSQLYPHMVEGARELSWSSFNKGTNLGPNHLPKILPPNAIS